jgi:hypothetical protein
MDLCFIKCIRVTSLGESGRSAKLATEFHLVSNFRINVIVASFLRSFHGVCWENIALFY